MTNWDMIIGYVDITILVVLICWMTLDRCQIYFNKDE